MNTADPTNNNTNDRYAGLSDEERAFAEGFDGPIEDAKPAEQEQPEGADDAQVDDGQQAQPEASAEGVDTPEGGDQPAQQDPLGALPEELRNRFQELESANREKERELARIKNDYAAVAGRLKPLQQRLAELERSGSNQQAQPQAQPATSTGHPSHLDGVFGSEKWKQYAELFPTEAESLQDVLTGAIKVTEQQFQQRVAQFEDRLKSFDPVIQRVEQREQELEFMERMKVLTDPHPDYKEIDATPEFRGWLDQQYIPSLPAMLRQQMMDPAYRNAVFSDPASVSEIMTAYKSTRAAQSAPARQPAPAQAQRQPDPRLSLSAAPNIRSEASPRPGNLAGRTEEELFQMGYNS